MAEKKGRAIKPLSLVLGIMIIWFMGVFGLAFYCWSKSYFVDFGPNLQTYNIDMRRDISRPGHVITFVASQPILAKSWLFGHMWVSFEEPPPDLPNGVRDYGYYAEDETNAAKELIKSVLLPWGYFTGQKPVYGILKDDTSSARELELKVRVDEYAYESALLADAKWRNEHIYLNHPPPGKPAYGCQDYDYAVANAIGLKTEGRHWREFPPESFVKFAALNGVKVRHHFGWGPG